jgi:hypothetical protein
MSNPEPNTTKRGPADVLVHLIVAFLTPMFLAVAGGDPRIARMAATEALHAYGTKNLADLIAIAQIIAFGLAVLDSLGRSMADALPDRLVLRLRGNASGLNRAAEQCRRTLRSAAPQDAAPYWLAADFDQEAERRREDAIIADVARATQRVAEVTAAAPAAAAAAAPAPKPAAQPMPVPAPAAPAARAEPAAPAQTTPAQTTPAQTTPAQTAPAPTTEEQFRRKAWASAMTHVAGEYTAEMARLPPSERRGASMRAKALSGVAHQLLSGEPLPPSILNTGRHGLRP